MSSTITYNSHGKDPSRFVIVDAMKEKDEIAISLLLMQSGSFCNCHDHVADSDHVHFCSLFHIGKLRGKGIFRYLYFRTLQDDRFWRVGQLVGWQRLYCGHKCLRLFAEYRSDYRTVEINISNHPFEFCCIGAPVDIRIQCAPGIPFIINRVRA